MGRQVLSLFIEYMKDGRKNEYKIKEEMNK